MCSASSTPLSSEDTSGNTTISEHGTKPTFVIQSSERRLVMSLPSESLPTPMQYLTHILGSMLWPRWWSSKPPGEVASLARALIFEGVTPGMAAFLSCHADIMEVGRGGGAGRVRG